MSTLVALTTTKKIRRRSPMPLNTQPPVTHRLDMATSGILMFAKHHDAEVAISKMLQAIHPMSLKEHRA